MISKKVVGAAYCFLMVQVVIMCMPSITLGGDSTRVLYEIEKVTGCGYYDWGETQPVREGQVISSCMIMYLYGNSYIILSRVADHENKIKLKGYLRGNIWAPWGAFTHWNKIHVPYDPPQGALIDLFYGQIETVEGPLCVGNEHCGVKTSVAWAVPCSTTQTNTRFVVGHDSLLQRTLIKNHPLSGSALATASVVDSTHTAELQPGEAIRYFSDGSFEFPCVAVFSGVAPIGLPGTTVHASYEIVNTTYAQETYNVTITDTLGWTAGPHTLVVDVPAKGTVVIPVEIDLPPGSEGERHAIVLEASGCGFSDGGILIVSSSSTIPTLSEWGLIVFGAVLLGFITWVFLKKRKAKAVSVVES
jgi:hypothetical protein